VAVTSGGKIWFKGDAPLAVWRDLPRWRWTGVLRIVPRAVRDFVYDRIARNRYRLFGRYDRCMVPTPDIKSRFIADSAALPPRARAA
jgi:predicted DCC family thiol-disulfide oxidoreductase YuxK